MPSREKSPGIPTGIAMVLLREHASGRFDELAKQYPDHKEALSSLKEISLSILAGDRAGFDRVRELLEKIVERADQLDDGYAFAAAQDVTNELEGLARGALSERVPVFPEILVGLRIPAAERGEPSAASDATPGSRTKFGGKPQWIQSDETPICTRCQKAMSFVAQIDSIANADTEVGHFLNEKKSFMFADVGMIYVFWCSGCAGTQAVFQCT